MSRHRRAAPSISAAAPKAARRRRLASSGPAWPGEPRTASPATGTVSSLTLARRVARSITGVGSSVSRGALGSTRNSVSPSGVRAGTRSTSATWAHGTKRLVPVSAQPFAVLSARVWVASGRQSRSASRTATVARASPVAIAESQRFFCASLPASAMARPASTVGKYGPGAAARPISSRRIAVSIMPSALPPYASGSESPSQPCWAISFHVVSLSPRGSSQRRRTAAGFMCSSRNARAEFFRSCWSGLAAHSMVSGLQAVGAYFLGQAEHAFADDVLLDLGRARVDRARPRPQKCGRPRAGLAGRGVDLLELFVRGDELPPRAQDLERQLVVALLELGVRELGDRRGRTGRLALLERRQRPQRGVALDLELGVDLAHLRAHDGIIDQALAAARELLGGPYELGEGDRVARDAAEGAGAALVAERGLRNLPPLVEAADEVPLLGREHLLQVALLLPVGPVDDDRRADEADPEPVDRRRRADPRHLVLDDRLLHRRGGPAAVLRRPQHPHVARLVEPPVPRLARVEGLQVVLGDVGLEPAPDAVPEGEVFGGWVQIHRAVSSLWGWTFLARGRG